MAETTDVEMEVVCAFCGRPKLDCTCRLTAGGSFGLLYAEGKEK